MCLTVWGLGNMETLIMSPFSERLITFPHKSFFIVWSNMVSILSMCSARFISSDSLTLEIKFVKTNWWYLHTSFFVLSFYIWERKNNFVLLLGGRGLWCCCWLTLFSCFTALTSKCSWQLDLKKQLLQWIIYCADVWNTSQ